MCRMTDLRPGRTIPRGMSREESLIDEKGKLSAYSVHTEGQL